MNYCLLVYIIFIPIIVFSTDYKTKLWIRIIRLLFLVALGHFLINLLLHHHFYLSGKKLDMIPNPTNEEFKRLTPNGPELAFCLVFGWIPFAVYICLWEFVYSNKMLKEFRGKATLINIFSNSIAFFTTFLIILVITPVISMFMPFFIVHILHALSKVYMFFINALNSVVQFPFTG